MKNNARQDPSVRALLCALAGAAFVCNSYAATASGAATATVIKPVSVGFVGVFDPATLAGSLSASGSLLRFGSGQAIGTVRINVTGREDLTFTVTQPVGGSVTIEFN